MFSLQILHQLHFFWLRKFSPTSNLLYYLSKFYVFPILQNIFQHTNFLYAFPAENVVLNFLQLQILYLHVFSNLTCQWPCHCLTDQVFFFNQVFNPVHQLPYHGLIDRVFSFFFFFFFNKHIFNPKRQWPYHGLTNRLFFSKTFYTWISVTITRSHRRVFKVR